MTITDSTRTISTNTDTEPSDWTRLGALGGVVFVVVSVIANFIPGTAPASDASATTITTYFRDHDGAIKIQLFASGLAIVFLLWWFGTLWRAMTRTSHQRPQLVAVAAVAFPIGIGLAALSGVFTATAAARVDTIGDGTQLLYTLSLVAGSTLGFPMFAWVAAVCGLNARGDIVPVWTNYLGWVAAFAFLASGLGVVSDANVYAVIGLAAFLAWCVWLVCVSITMWRRSSNI